MPKSLLVELTQSDGGALGLMVAYLTDRDIISMSATSSVIRHSESFGKIVDIRDQKSVERLLIKLLERPELAVALRDYIGSVRAGLARFYDLRMTLAVSKIVEMIEFEQQHTHIKHHTDVVSDIGYDIAVVGKPAWDLVKKTNLHRSFHEDIHQHKDYATRIFLNKIYGKLLAKHDHAVFILSRIEYQEKLAEKRRLDEEQRNQSVFYPSTWLRWLGF